MDMLDCSSLPSHLDALSESLLLSLVNFLLINITGLEYAENPSFNIPI